MRRSFPVTDPDSVITYNKVLKVLYKLATDTEVVYHSNWYVVVACTSNVIADRVVTRLNRVDGQWDIEKRNGLKNKFVYLSIQLKTKQGN